MTNSHISSLFWSRHMFESQPDTAVPLWASLVWTVCVGLDCCERAVRGGSSEELCVKQLPNRCACLIFLPSWHLNASKESIQADEQMLHSSLELNCLHSRSLWTNKQPQSCHTRLKMPEVMHWESWNMQSRAKVFSHKRPFFHNVIKWQLNAYGKKSNCTLPLSCSYCNIPWDLYLIQANTI